MTTPTLPSSPSDHKDLQLNLLTELSAALRGRSEPEHLYTAAALGGFGAVAWGVAALQPEKYLSKAIYQRPGGVAALGTLLVATAIVLKICREHREICGDKKGAGSHRGPAGFLTRRSLGRPCGSVSFSAFGRKESGRNIWPLGRAVSQFSLASGLPPRPEPI